MKRLLPILGLVLFCTPFYLLTNPVWLVDWQLGRIYGSIIHEEQSDFSLIRVRERDSLRSLTFVDEDGREQLQSGIDLAAPGELQLAYTRALFSSLLFRNPQEKALIVGLGGGGMVRFIEAQFPENQLTVVEIDPAVVRLAAEYFETSPGPKTTILTEDAFVFLEETGERFDAIYMDAFLRPPAESDLNQKTTRLKTVDFLEGLKSRLTPGGIVAFNLISFDPDTPEDLASLREVFPQVYVFSVVESRNLAVIASQDSTRLSLSDLRQRAARFDAGHEVGFPLTTIVDQFEITPVDRAAMTQ